MFLLGMDGGTEMQQIQSQQQKHERSIGALTYILYLYEESAFEWLAVYCPMGSKQEEEELV